MQDSEYRKTIFLKFNILFSFEKKIVKVVKMFVKQIMVFVAFIDALRMLF